MMQDEAFLEAIRQAPDDDAPRLIYADWLEEHGQPERAEFIRLECERERVPEHSPRWHELVSRASPLYKKHQVEWLGSLSEILSTYAFSRGFLEFVGLPAEQFLKHADAIFRLGPIQEVSLDDAHDFLPALADFAPLSRVRVLNLSHNHIGSEEIRVLGSSSYLDQLTELDLSLNDLDSEAIAELRQAPFFPRLCSLDLGSNRDVGATAIEFLADIQEPISLTKLVLRFNTLGAAGVQALTASRVFYRGLTYLDLTGCQTPAAGARALAHAKGKLTSLQLGWNPLGDDGVQVLAGSPAFARLAELDLSECELGSEAAAALARSSSVRGLTRLDLSRNRISSRGARALASSPNFSHLSLLELTANEIGDEGAKALASSPHFAQLNALFLANNGLQAWGLRELIMSPHLANLYTLDLDDNNLGDVGAQVIARWCRLPQLTSLRLRSNLIGDLGLQELSDSPHLESMRDLDLSDNRFAEEGKAALQSSALQKRLLSLKLSDDERIGHSIFNSL